MSGEVGRRSTGHKSRRNTNNSSGAVPSALRVPLRGLAVAANAKKERIGERFCVNLCSAVRRLNAAPVYLSVHSIKSPAKIEALDVLRSVTMPPKLNVKNCARGNSVSRRAWER